MANNQIALMAQTPVFDTPFESQGKALQLRSLMNQGQVQDMDMAQRRQAISDDTAMRDVYRTTSDPAEQIKALYRVNPKAAMAAEKSKLDLGKMRGDIAETQAKTSEIGTKQAVTRFDAIGQTLGALSSVPNGATPQQVTTAVQHLVDIGMINPTHAQGVISSMPQDPRQMNAWLQQSQASVMKAKDQVAMTTPDANARLTAQTSLTTNANTNATAQRGQNMTAGTAAAGRAQSATQHAATLGLQREKLGAPGKSGPMSVTLQKELLESDDGVQSSKAVVDILNEALKINKTAYSGYGAKGRAILASNLPGATPGADATINLDNMMTGQALESLKTVFGGMPTEGERKILLDMQASADKTPVQREAIMTRAISAAQRRGEYAKQKAKSIRSGAYLSEGMPEAAADPLDSLLDKYK